MKLRAFIFIFRSASQRSMTTKMAIIEQSRIGIIKTPPFIKMENKAIRPPTK
jgi:hypothetical protein